MNATLERLLGGIYVTEEPRANAPANGYVTVTREGLRLTRTSVSLRPGDAGFAREARWRARPSAWTSSRKDQARCSTPAGERLGCFPAHRAARGQGAEYIHARRALPACPCPASRETRVLRGSRTVPEGSLARRELRETLSAEALEKQESLWAAEAASAAAESEVAAATRAASAADAAAEESGRRLKEARTALSEGMDRRDRISRRLAHARRSPAGTPTAQRRSPGARRTPQDCSPLPSANAATRCAP